MNKTKDMFFNLFGVGKGKIAKRVILTPIFGLNRWRKYFDNISEEFNSKYYFSGINGTVNNENITVIFSGQGIQRVCDCTYFLKDTICKKIVYCGAVGGIGEVSLGDIIISDKIYGLKEYNFKNNIKNVKHYTYLFDSNTEKAINNIIKKENKNIRISPIISLTGFFQENKKTLGYLERKGIKGVDFESFIFVNAAKEIGITPVVINFVYDLPGKINFYDKNKEIIDVRNRATEEIIKLSLELVSRI